MFIIYTLSKGFKTWEYECTLKADLPNIVDKLTELCDKYDGFCDQWQLFYEIAHYQYFRGAKIRIYFVEVSYGIWNS